MSSFKARFRNKDGYTFYLDVTYPLQPLIKLGSPSIPSVVSRNGDLLPSIDSNLVTKTYKLVRHSDKSVEYVEV